ncbi:MAG: [NiFe]-hydrogenase assembly chaperone HybE [Rhodocyclaceae bacterium]|nr:[NiFe]-hydrogenase assembly chaperone HybE [Rhodocyclaceae bacterium]
MTAGLRKPAWTPPPVVVARPLADDPSAAIAAWFTRVHDERMAGLPFLNPALFVEVLGLRRLHGDWLGGLITPWSVQLVLLPGGGGLWQDISAGLRRAVALPVGELAFIADAGEDGLEAYQYCPLGTSTAGFADQAAARRFLVEALEAVMTPPAPVAEAPEAVPASTVDRGRRALFGLGGRR